MSSKEDKTITNYKELIINHYDDLISEIDIYAESVLEKLDESTASKSKKKQSEKESIKEYLNEVRFKALDTVKSLQSNNIAYYNENRDEIKSRISEIESTIDKIESIKSELLSKKFCFLLHLNKNELINSNIILEIVLIVLEGLYLSKNDIQFIR